MSDFTDYMEQMFFSEATNIRERIYESKRWINDYLYKRKSYPEWVTRDGVSIKVEDITDQHLNNLINFLPKRNIWYQVFICEKKYRELNKKMPELEKANAKCEQIIDLL